MLDSKTQNMLDQMRQRLKEQKPCEDEKCPGDEVEKYSEPAR